MNNTQESYDYIANCISNNLGISGKRLKTLGGNDIESVYRNLFPKEGHCIGCGNDVTFINYKKGFGNKKYCSVSCMNTSENANKNIRKAFEIKSKHDVHLNKIQNEYDNSYLTIKDIAKKYKVSACFVRDSIQINPNRQAHILTHRMGDKFKDIKIVLDESKFKNFTSQEIAEDLGCSTIYTWNAKC